MKRTVLCASKNSRMIDNKIIEISLHGFNLKTYGPSWNKAEKVHDI